MSEFTLVIGNKNYSSWSLRPWILMKYSGIPFSEISIPLYQEVSRENILEYSPSGKVPALIHSGITIWESIAICEYIAELFPEKRLLPENREARAFARSISAEMHAGFQALRNNMSMNLRASLPGKGMTPEVEADIRRIIAIWRECRRRFGAGGDFLFGGFTIADAMYAPVVTRFMTYGVGLSRVEREYSDSILNLPAMQEWYAGARAETHTIPQFDAV